MALSRASALRSADADVRDVAELRGANLGNVESAIKLAFELSPPRVELAAQVLALESTSGH